MQFTLNFAPFRDTAVEDGRCIHFHGNHLDYSVGSLDTIHSAGYSNDVRVRDKSRTWIWGTHISESGQIHA